MIRIYVILLLLYAVSTRNYLSVILCSVALYLLYVNRENA
jgi:hypothetical protein